MTFDEAIKIVKAHEATKYQARELSGQKLAEFAVNAVSRTQTGECFRCGNRTHKANDENCPAKDVNCNSCGKKGHFARKCMTMKAKRSYEGRERESYKRRRVEVRRVEFEKDQDQSSPTRVHIFNVNDGGVQVVCAIGNVCVKMMVNSGTSRSIIDDNIWKLMIANRFEPKKKFFDSTVRFTGYGNKELEQVHAFTAPISVCNAECDAREENATFYVIQKGSQPLLSQGNGILFYYEFFLIYINNDLIGTATALGILRIRIPSQLAIPINDVTTKCTFPKIKGVMIHVYLKPGAIPSQMPLRRAPVAMLGKIKEQLEELEALDIIERVEEPSPWVSALVPVVKNCGGLRLCIDLRRLNECIEREHHPLPNFEEMLPSLANARVFSVLDVKSAYHQCELDKESRPLTTFITSFGRFRYKRLVFGISCAPEKFQKVMESLLSRCKNVICYIDDILVYGNDEVEHDTCLAKVLDELKNYDVMLNSQKCRLKQRDVVFLGHHLSSKGIEPMESKVLAVKQFRPPQTKEEVRSFLGLVCYVGRFIPDLATTTEPLRQLMKKDTEFVWSDIHQKAFERIKNTVFGVLGYFDPKRKTRLVADASQ